MRRLILLIFPAILLLLLVSGCERKVVNEYTTQTEPGATAVCFTCHSDNDFKLVQARDEYDESGHGTGHTYNENRNNESFYSSCEGCHTNEGFVARMTGVPVSGDKFTRIACFTCHEPHTTGTLALRTTEAVTLSDGTTEYDNGASNLCVHCHHGRQNVNTYVYDDDTLSTHFGPHHGPQSDMLMGANAYEYEGFEYTNFHAHSTATDGCLQCHMAKPLYATGGHSFYMADEANEYENTSGCNNGCHNGGVEGFDHDGVQANVETLLDSLETLLVDAGLLEEVDEGGVISLDPTDGLVVSTADSVGAVFNYIYVKEDRSMGIHNPYYSVDLLESSIEFMNGDIPARAPQGLDQRPIASH
jgi:hypothetical protein